MSEHRAGPSSLKGLSADRRKPSGRRAAEHRKRSPLVRIAASYALAAVLALGGGAAVYKSFDASAVDSSPVAAKTYDNAANFLSYLETPQVPESLKKPVAAKIAPAPAAQPVKKPVAAPAVERQAPDHLVIPALGVSSLIVESPLRDNALVIPSSEFVGEYTEGTPLTGTSGTTLIVGHVNFADGSMGALGPITYAKPGQIVKASDGTGKIHKYRITTVETFVKRALPDEVFATTGPRRLVMVTCGGPIVEMPGGGMGYRDNVVVTAVPVS